MTDRGERGPVGDHGQQGDPGVTGLKGERGPQGAQGPEAPTHWYTLTDNRLLAIFGVVVLTGVLFIQGLSAQQAELEKANTKIQQNLESIERARYQSCLGGVKIIIKFNSNQERFKQLATERPDLDPAVKQDLINAYNASKFEVPNCSALDPDHKK